MRVILAAALIASLGLPAMAADFPKSPKIGPPEPLPEAVCDPSVPHSGDWILGNWVAPRTKWSFQRQADGITWIMDRKGAIDEGFGWSDGTTIDGVVTTVTGCTVTLQAGQGAFQFQGVLTDAGHLFGYATNPKGKHMRFTLRRER